MVIKTLWDPTSDNSFSDLKEYFLLRNEIDRLCSKLEEAHKEHITCHPGCHQCCMDFNIFPIEFYSIQYELKGNNACFNPKAANPECLFLIKGLCSIYVSRPVICRTHGLPLLQMGEDEWQLSYCELNFKKDNLPDFDESNTFVQDRFNSRLFLINREFIKKLTDNQYSETDLIPLRELRAKLMAQRRNGTKAE
jgi:Fe-S-cluster containining protein